MFSDDDSVGSNILSSLFLGGMFYLFQKRGEQKAHEEIKQQIQTCEIDELRKQLKKLNEENALRRKMS